MSQAGSTRVCESVCFVACLFVPREEGNRTALISHSCRHGLLPPSRHWFFTPPRSGLMAEEFVLSTPTKSPAAKKKRGDDAVMDPENLELLGGTGERGQGSNAPGMGGGTPATIEAISALLTSQLGRLRDSVETLKTDMGTFKQQIGEDVQGMKTGVGELKAELYKTKEAADNAVSIAKDAKMFMQKELSTMSKQLEAAEQSTNEKIKIIEKTVSDLRLTPSPNHKDTKTAMVGGLEGAPSAVAAKEWVKDVLAKGNIGFLKIYDKCKETKFNGKVFVEFVSPEKRDEAIQHFSTNTNKHGDADTFMKIDQPIQIRTQTFFLLNLKKLLNKWGFKNVKFDEAGFVGVAGVPILQATVDGYEFKIK